jgi:hypothetical protein
MIAPTRQEAPTDWLITADRNAASGRDSFRHGFAATPPSRGRLYQWLLLKGAGERSETEDCKRRRCLSRRGYGGPIRLQAGRAKRMQADAVCAERIHQYANSLCANIRRAPYTPFLTFCPWGVSSKM